MTEDHISICKTDMCPAGEGHDGRHGGVPHLSGDKMGGESNMQSQGVIPRSSEERTLRERGWAELTAERAAPD